MRPLDAIIAAKRRDIAAMRRAWSPAAFRDHPVFSTATRPFASALTAGRSPAVIAEVKRLSPSAGTLDAAARTDALAAAYARNGAAAVSILTEETSFGGHPSDLARARAAVDVPLLRKDFILDEIQLYESRAIGADAVLLIASILEPGQLRDLHDAAAGIGLECLVEVHTEEEVGRTDFRGVRLVGVNNRDLSNLTIDLGTTARLVPLLPPGITVVSESGIRSAGDVRSLVAGGAHAVLIGEHFMRSPDPGAALGALIDELRGD